MEAEKPNLLRVRIMNANELHLISEDENLVMGENAWNHGPTPFWASGDIVEMTEEDYHRYQRIRDEWYAAHSELWRIIREKNGLFSFYEAAH